MFRCQKCETVVPAGTRETKIVTETREKIYEARGGGDRGRFRRGMGRRARRREAFDKGGVGREIVREISVCPKCAAELLAEQQAQAAVEETASAAGS